MEASTPRFTSPAGYDPMDLNSAILATADHGVVKLDLPSTGAAAEIRLHQVLLLLDAHRLTPCLIRSVGSRWILTLRRRAVLRVAA